MKKHPVDDLFKSKLSGLEKQPSSSAWTRIAKEQKTQSRRVGMWVWYAAASFVVAVMTGYLVWQESQKIVTESTIAKTEKLEDFNSSISEDTLKVSKFPAEKEEEKQIAIVEPVESKQTIKRSSEVKVDINKDLKMSAPVIEPEIGNLNNLKIEEISGIAPDDIKMNVSKSISPTIEKELSVAPSLVESNEENRTIVVKVEMPENESGEKVKSSRFSKVFRQLKNVRAGDPVDWQEVGFNPKNIIAKVDGRIRGKGDDNVERDQNSKRTKL